MRKILLLHVLVFSAFSDLFATTYYVDAQKSNNNGNGISWATAKKDLQNAINLSVAGDSVLVAEGTYCPTEAINGTSTDPRDLSFSLDKDITLIGGFPSGGIQTAGRPGPSILSGDIGARGNDVDNCYHVLVTAGLTPTALIKGFVIINGRGDGSGTVYFSGKDFYRSSGGGMYNRKSSPTINSVVIAHNYAFSSGGLYNYEADVSLRNSAVCFNSANTSGGIRNALSNASFVNITVAFNSANDGPGIVVYLDTLEISNSVVYGNIATSNCASDVCITFATIRSGSKKNASNIFNGTLSGLPGFQYLSSSPFAGNPAGPDSTFMTLDDGLRPRFGSNLINNAGALLALPDTIDITGVPRLIGGYVDIGAYEYNCTSYSGLVHKSCNASFMAPSGKIITTSGTYMDTLLNAQNCDSLIRLDVKVNPRTIYVDASRPDNSGDGYSWATAKKDLQNGLDLAITDTGCDTIKVAEGTYFPTQSPNGDTTNQRYFWFHIDKDLILLGGYPTGGGKRDFINNKTILSGDLGIPNDKSDNSYHVLITANLTPVSLIDGFTIIAGNGDGPNINIPYGERSFPTSYSGGMCNNYSSPVISNMIFENNSATFGGGMYNLYSAPVITNTVFDNNLAYAIGGGLRNSTSHPSLHNVVFNHNTCPTQWGGGMANAYSSTPKLSNVAFIDNHSSQNGSAIDNDNSTTLLHNTVFYGNGSNTVINRAGGSIATGSRNNASDIITTSLSGMLNTVVLTSDPFLNLAAPAGGDSLWMTPDDGLRPAHGSSLVDAGTLAIPGTLSGKDITSLARVYNDSVDIGPYELLCESHSGLNITRCNSFTTPGGQLATTSGIYHDTLTNHQNCDSIVTSHVTINNAPVYFVDISRPDNSGSGTSWATAKKDLQDAINLATAGNGCSEIKIAEGVYYPTSSLDSSSADPRDKTFRIEKDLTISGGFPQGGGAQNPQKYNTILSGDIGVVNDSTDNCYHIMVMHGLSSVSKFENLIITDGNANGSGYIRYFDENLYRSRGAAMVIAESSLNLSELVIYRNRSQSFGSVLLYDARPTFVNILFTQNFGNFALNHSSSEAIIKNSTFFKNYSGIYSSDLTLINCVFYKNFTDAFGAPAAGSSNNASDIINSFHLYQTPNFVHLSTDPFVNAANPIGTDGLWMTSDDGLQPKSASALVDMGASITLPEKDLAGGIRVFNTIPDLGAYELNCSNGILYANGTLTANTPNTSYQWVDCNDDFSTIPGATAQTFTPATNGSYAVITNSVNCSDTSACYSINNVSLPENRLETEIHLYPNPTTGNVNLALPVSTSGSVKVEIFNSLGQAVEAYSVNAAEIIELPLPDPQGIYFLKIRFEGNTVVKKVVKE